MTTTEPKVETKMNWAPKTMLCHSVSRKGHAGWLRAGQQGGSVLPEFLDPHPHPPPTCSPRESHFCLMDLWGTNVSFEKQTKTIHWPPPKKNLTTAGATLHIVFPKPEVKQRLTYFPSLLSSFKVFPLCPVIWWLMIFFSKVQKLLIRFFSKCLRVLISFFICIFPFPRCQKETPDKFIACAAEGFSLPLLFSMSAP